jgi:hypothetical protein
MSPVPWKRVRELFESAMELPVEERHDWLRRESADSEELRLEVERLLASARTAQDFLTPPADSELAAHAVLDSGTPIVTREASCSATLKRNKSGSRRSKVARVVPTCTY